MSAAKGMAPTANFRADLFIDRGRESGGENLTFAPGARNLIAARRVDGRVWRRRAPVDRDVYLGGGGRLGIAQDR